MFKRMNPETILIIAYLVSMLIIAAILYFTTEQVFDIYNKLYFFLIQ